MVVEKGTGVVVTDMPGTQRLMWWRVWSSQERRVLVKALLGAGVDMDLFNRNLETVLHLVVLQGGEAAGEMRVGQIHHWVSRCVWLWVGDMAATTRMLLQDVTDAYKNTSDASCS